MAYAEHVVEKLRVVPGVVDATIAQTLEQPTLLISAHRAFALGAALTEVDVSNNTLAAIGLGAGGADLLARSKDRCSHLVNVQTPQAQLT